ncbi:hypothetical protein GCM10011576_04860 [Micromonospora parathelypteridis]|nr:hypothetical protein GCM10011576_04860 [Micromonospora parathelypteridis]
MSNRWRSVGRPGASGSVTGSGSVPAATTPGTTTAVGAAGSRHGSASASDHQGEAPVAPGPPAAGAGQLGDGPWGGTPATGGTGG